MNEATQTVTWDDMPLGLAAEDAGERAPDSLSGVGEALPDLLAFYLRPHFVDVEARIQDMIVILLFASVLALVVWRSRRLVMRQIAVARERANLARYFPPTVVDRLARQDKPLGAVRAQPVAVMFVDIVAFTEFAEASEPERVVETLRAYHARVERAIFVHGGTLDKFLGDGVMATFGTPDAGPRDAVNALATAAAIRRDMAAWNETRREAGEAPVAVAIGLHYGEVVLGDIGSERRLELAVLGDVVNVASRLEELTRTLGCRAALSGDVVEAARRQDPAAAESLLADFREGAPQALRGRATEAGLQVEGSNGTFTAPADVMPTSYWDADTVTQSRLLDTQRGRLIDVDIVPAGSETVDAGVIVTRYSSSGTSGGGKTTPVAVRVAETPLSE